MHGIDADDPGRFGLEIRLMREMHWSWADLQDAPWDLVDELAVRLEAERKWTEKKRKLEAEKKR